jgi:hypothetical protein
VQLALSEISGGVLGLGQSEYMMSLETRAPVTADPPHAFCTRPVSAPLPCLLLSSTISHSSPNRRQHIMLLEEAISLLAILTPIAKAVPVLGSPVEGSLEALSKLLELAKARRLPVAWTICAEP